MVDRPSEPERTLIFADGGFAELGDCYEDKKKDEMVFMFRPTQRMKWRNEIEEDDYDEIQGWIKKSYPSDLCFPLDVSPDYQTWIIFCDYRRNPCDLTKRINQRLLDKIDMYKKESDAMRTLFNLRFIKLKKIIKYPEEFKSEVIDEFMKQKKAVSSGYDETPTKPGGFNV